MQFFGTRCLLTLIYMMCYGDWTASACVWAPLNVYGILQEDWIGLRTLDEAGKLVFDEIPGGHMHFNLEW